MTVPPSQPRPRERCLPEAIEAWIDRQERPTPQVERVPLASAAGRVLAEPVFAPADQPAQHLAVTDGYGLRAEETQGASDYNPLPLRLVAPGVLTLRLGEAAPVSSGQPLPDGADAVIPAHLAEDRGGVLEVWAPVARGEHIVQRGEEARAGDALLQAGRTLRAQDLAWLAAAGMAGVKVQASPRVRVVVARAVARDADGPMLQALVSRDGGELESVEVAPTRPALEAALRRPGTDLILVAGGSGPGGNDHSAAALGAVGDLMFHGTAIHPGDSAGAGRAGGALVVLLPGTPLACLWVYDLFAARALRRMAGRAGRWPYPARRLPLARKVSSRIGQLELCRLRVVNGHAVPLATAEGHSLGSAVQADGFLPVPVQSEGYPAGAEVTVYLYSPG